MLIHNLSLFMFMLILIRQQLYSQEMNTVQQEYVEDMMETVLEGKDEEIDLSELTDDLIYYLRHPLNLNTATKDDLCKLQMLNDFQIAALIDYREKIGYLRSVFELLYIPGYRAQDIEKVASFVTCEEVRRTFKESSKFEKHEILIRWQRILEKQGGYLSIPDSILAENPYKSRYLGSADKIYVRYRFAVNDFIKAGFIMEKDAGEEFFSGSNKQGFDFYSAYMHYKNEHSWIQDIVIGDFQIQTGQGLLAWSSYSLGKTSQINNLCRRSHKVKGNISAQENRLLRGGALTIGRKRFSCTAYVSGIHVDAILADSSEGDTKFINFVETGYHNTPNELEKEKSIALKTVGASVWYHSSKLKLGLNSVHTSFSKSLDESELLYKQLSFSGKAITGFSADYHYLGGITQFFGETAISNNNLATLNGILFYFRPGINIGTIYRWYQPAYYSYYASAFGEGSNVGNENGFFLVGEFNFSDNRFKVYGDIFSFPWLKYRVNAPSEGNELSIEAGRKLQHTDISFSYKRCEKPKNNSTGNHVEVICSFITEKYRLNGTCLVGDKIRLQNRIELSQAAFQGSEKVYGILVFQDIVWHNLPGTFEFWVRVGYYHVSNYDARIYMYERDVLYANSTFLCYGKGWRFSGLIKWQPAELITFWLHLGSSIYPKEEFNGSGLNTINTNHRTEIKIEAVIRF